MANNILTPSTISSNGDGWAKVSKRDAALPWEIVKQLYYDEHGKPMLVEITVFSKIGGALTKTISLKDGKPVFHWWRRCRWRWVRPSAR